MPNETLKRLDSYIESQLDIPMSKPPDYSPDADLKRFLPLMMLGNRRITPMLMMVLQMKQRKSEQRQRKWETMQRLGLSKVQLRAGLLKTQADTELARLREQRAQLAEQRAASLHKLNKDALTESTALTKERREQIERNTEAEEREIAARIKEAERKLRFADRFDDLTEAEIETGLARMDRERTEATVSQETAGPRIRRAHDLADAAEVDLEAKLKLAGPETDFRLAQIESGQTTIDAETQEKLRAIGETQETRQDRLAQSAALGAGAKYTERLEEARNKTLNLKEQIIDAKVKGDTELMDQLKGQLAIQLALDPQAPDVAYNLFETKLGQVAGPPEPESNRQGLMDFLKGRLMPPARTSPVRMPFDTGLFGFQNTPTDIERMERVAAGQPGYF
jgi:hypothetical protein